MQSMSAVVIFTVPIAAAGALLSWSAWRNRRRTKRNPILQDLHDQYNQMCDNQTLAINHILKINPDPQGKKLRGFLSAPSGGKSDVHLRN